MGTTALSMDLRQRVVEAFQQGEGTSKQLARRFGVGRATVQRWMRLTRETGSPAPRPHGGGQTHRIGDGELSAFRRLVDEQPDRTRAEMARAWTERTGVRVSVATIGRTLTRLGYTLKKSPLPDRTRTTRRPSPTRGLSPTTTRASDAQGVEHRRGGLHHRHDARTSLGPDGTTRGASCPSQSRHRAEHDWRAQSRWAGNRHDE